MAFHKSYVPYHWAGVVFGRVAGWQARQIGDHYFLPIRGSTESRNPHRLILSNL